MNKFDPKDLIHNFEFWMIEAFREHVEDQSPNTFPRKYKIKVSVWEKIMKTDPRIVAIKEAYHRRINNKRWAHK